MLIRTINYLYIAYVVLWPLIFALFLNFDAAGRGYILMATIAILFNLTSNRFCSCIKVGAISAWILWSAFVALVWLNTGQNSTNLDTFGFLFLKIALPLISLIISCRETYRNPQKFSIFLFCLYFAYSCTGFLFEERSTSSALRGGGILGNSLPLTTVCACFIACLCEYKGWLSKRVVYICVAVAMGCIFITATRKAFVALLIILVNWYFVKNKFSGFVGMVRNVGIGVAGYLLITQLLNNSVLGSRLVQTALEENKYNTTNSVVLDFLGDRAYFYIEGWKLFLDYPLCGIGLRNFMVVKNFPHPIHSEFMVQLTETGILGTLLYVVFYACIFRLIIRAKTVSQNCDLTYCMLLSFVVCILFISLTSWVYEFSRYYVIFGLIIGLSRYIIENRKYEDCPRYK